MRVRLSMCLLLLASHVSCGEFETYSIVLDLRVLAMSMEPPEDILSFDPLNPPQGFEDLEIGDAEVCALVADPGSERSLGYRLRACPPSDSDRCDDPNAPVIELAAGTVDDPESADQPVSICGTLRAGIELFVILQRSLEDDSLSGFGGLLVQIELAIFPAGASPDDPQAQFAIKSMLYSPELPAGRTANQNPAIDSLKATLADASVVAVPLGRCGDIEPLVVSAGDALELEPVESAGAREDYVVPTLSGGSRMFTENLTYAWYATSGRWSRGVSGGTKDPAGNDPPIDSTWTAPTDPAAIGDGLDTRIWLVQRDERGGLRWYESCIRVMP